MWRDEVGWLCLCCGDGDGETLCGSEVVVLGGLMDGLLDNGIDVGGKSGRVG